MRRCSLSTRKEGTNVLHQPGAMVKRSANTRGCGSYKEVGQWPSRSFLTDSISTPTRCSPTIWQFGFHLDICNNVANQCRIQPLPEDEVGKKPLTRLGRSLASTLETAAANGFLLGGLVTNSRRRACRFGVILPPSSCNRQRNHADVHAMRDWPLSSFLRHERR